MAINSNSRRNIGKAVAATKIIPKLQSSQIYQGVALRTPSQALRTMVSRDGLGIYASSDTRFEGAIFGRDSLEVAEDLLPYKPRLVERIILTLASLQGEVYDDTREEEAGRIVHEYRRTIVDGKPLNDTSRRIYDILSEAWGGDDLTMAYYGSVDAAPHFIRLVFKYVDTYGPKILERKVRLRSGHLISLSIAIENSLDWINSRLEHSKSGLLEYQRHNPKGLSNQVWKDSEEFYVHENARQANHKRPIASIEVQGLVYDALMAAANHFPGKKTQYSQTAIQLRDRTIQLLWLPKRRYFALGTDFTANSKKPRVITTPTANPAELLNSGFFDLLPLNRKQLYVSSVVREIMGSDFLTDAGTRSRALSRAHLVKIWDYHGSYTTWPKETYDIAKGLRRQGFERLAIELENRLLNVVRALKAYPEFIYVDYRGRILGAAAAPHRHAQTLLVNNKDRPERIQAWTASAIYAIAASRRRQLLGRQISFRRKSPVNANSWQYQLESEILQHIPLMPYLRSSRTLAARYPAYPYQLKID